jgi:hypothetical protein
MVKLPLDSTTAEPLTEPEALIVTPPVKPVPVRVIVPPWTAPELGEKANDLAMTNAPEVCPVASALDLIPSVLEPMDVGLMIPAEAANWMTGVVTAEPEWVIVTARPTTRGSAVGATPLMETDVLSIDAGTVVPEGNVTVTVPFVGIDVIDAVVTV